MTTSDRRPYKSATVLDQGLLDECSENLVCDLRMICTIETPASSSYLTDTLYLSDRNMVVGTNFYQARVTFPTIKRSVGRILEPAVSFSTQQIKVNNSDGFFNKILPAGSEYDSLINRRVTIKVGLAEVQATYDSNIIFDGFITEVGGFSRDMSSFTIIARDKFDDLNQTFPTSLFKYSEFPDLDDQVVGKPKPILLGNWVTNLEIVKESSVPAIIVNGNDPTMNGTTSNVANIKFLISENANRDFFTNTIVLVRSSLAYTISSSDVVNVSADKNYFEITQNTGNTLIDGANYIFKSSDSFFCQANGAEIDSLSAYPENAVEQARYILKNFGNASASDFSSGWDTLRSKNSPAESSIATIKSRAYIDKPEKALSYALSILEQVRCEDFINRSQKIEISTNHWEDFNASPTTEMLAQDIERKSFQPKIQEINNFNKVQSFYNLLPDVKENYSATNFFVQQDSINQSKEIAKGLVFPNLYVASDVNNQTKEYLKFTSGFREDIFVTVTWKFLLQEINDFISLNVEIGGTTYNNIPLRVRDISFLNRGMKIKMRCWSFQMLPFQTWNPGYNGIVGGQNAIINAI